tara:strand:- start:991 stop:1389 length:399 start_codon:yes stop_codon:yes gene_type:complete
MDLEILKIASNTDNNRNINDHTHFSKLRNSLCGDEIKIKLIVKNNRIVDFGYQGKSCVYCQASVSLLSKISLNNKISKIDKICDSAKNFFDNNSNKLEANLKPFKKLLKKKNYFRKNCILLPFKTLKRIVSN